MTSPMDALGGRRLVLVCGSGGVGKTTTSAALGLALARTGARVLVITVDPAKRLAQALGLDGIGVGEQDVRVDGGGSMSISMLDTKAGWDELVRRHARDEATARRILSNSLYANITARFVNSHDYIAMEKLHELGRDPRFDAVVVDTPPSRNALDLLDAPTRMREFFGGRLLRWLTLPYRSKALTLASRPFLNVADRILGAQFLSDIAEFFTLLQSMEAGFVERATAVERTLRSAETASVVVTSAEPAAGEEALFLLRELGTRSMNPALVVVNRMLPDPGISGESLLAPGVVESMVSAGIGGPAETRGLVSAMSHALAEMRITVDAQNEVVDALERESTIVVRVPLAGRESDGGGPSAGVEVIASSLLGA